MLLVAADKAVLYTAAGGSVAHSYLFPAGDTGLAAFARYLAEAPEAPIAVLVDAVEEEYRQDTVPHVFGRDRRAVLSRKFARLFRGTPYCIALAQGRESAGRGDDRVLLAALTKPELVTPWVAEILAQHVPLSGIHSLPILSQQLLPELGAGGENVLLISVQGATGLRQSFFRNGQLKISRLAAMPRAGAVPYAAHLLSELDKLRRYLNSLALVARDSPLAVYVLSHGEALAELESQCRDSDAERYFLVDVAALARRLGVHAELATPCADALFAQLLLRSPPRTSYAQPAESRYYRLYQARVGLLVASVLMLVASTGFSTLQFLDAVGQKRQALDAAQKADFYQARFELAREALPPTPIEPQAMRQAVELATALEQRKGSPLPLLSAVGEVLAKAPWATLERVEWEALEPGAGPATAPVATGDAAFEAARHESLLLRGRVSPFEGDYRGAIARIDALAAALSRASGQVAVDVVEYPLDLRPGASMSGVGQRAAALEARFAIRIVRAVDGDRAG